MRTLGRSHVALWTSLALLLSVGCAPSVAPAVTPAAAPATAAPAPIVAVAAAPAPPPPPAPPPLEGDGPQTVSVPIEGSDLVRGRTAVKVNAPIARVRESVLDFAHYAEFMPHYLTSRLLGRTATGARDVYMEIEALHGAVKMWVEIEFAKPILVDGVETHVSKFVKGNVEEFLAIWRLRKIDELTTELSLEVFLQPSIPLPTSLMNKENVSGSLKGVQAMRGRIEGAAASP
jgi:hypothetical protein